MQGQPAVVSNTPKPNVFPFLKLPGEIRNMIYHFIFRMPVRLYLDTSGSSKRGNDHYIVHRRGRRPKQHWPSGQLLRVNRQVYHEGLPVLLAVNHFTIDSFRNLQIFLEAIKPMRRASIRSFRVHWGQNSRKRSNEAMKMTFSLLCECTNLQHLRMTLPNLKSLAAVRRLTLADNKDIVRPFPRLDRLTLEYICTPDVGHSASLRELHSMYHRMAGSDGKFHLEHYEYSFFLGD